jgi:hypothetical protein
MQIFQSFSFAIQPQQSSIYLLRPKYDIFISQATKFVGTNVFKIFSRSWFLFTDRIGALSWNETRDYPIYVTSLQLYTLAQTFEFSVWNQDKIKVMNSPLFINNTSSTQSFTHSAENLIQKSFSHWIIHISQQSSSWIFHDVKTWFIFDVKKLALIEPIRFTLDCSSTILNLIGTMKHFISFVLTLLFDSVDEISFHIPRDNRVNRRWMIILSQWRN